jgi:cell division protein FtsZ
MAHRDRRGRDRRSRPIEPKETGEPVELLEIGPETADEELFEFEGTSRLQAHIKVIGVGGGGGNALNNMIRSSLSGVEFVAANTDSQALEHSLAPIRLQLGSEVTRGLGCGSNPEKGRTAALEARDRLRELLVGTDMVFVTAGLGGGTGTGGAPVIAEIAREVGALTVAVVTKPFQFEGRVRMRHAGRGFDELHRVVDTVITIPNQRLLALAGKTASVQDAFRLADDVLLNAVRGISDLITVHGLINLDFADIRTIMNEMGMALMGTGMGRGETRALDASRAAISSPLLEDLSIDGARGVLINVTGGSDMTLFEVNEAASLIQESCHEEANIIFGAVIDEEATEGEVRVTVIATGLDDGHQHPARERDRPADPWHNVTPLRRDPEPLSDPAPARTHGGSSSERASSRPPTATRPAGPDDWMSPFEDELDVPTFLRRGQGDEGPEESELPAFLRRSAD